MRTVTTYDEIAVKATRYWTDETGKRRQETRKFFQTQNPYNRGADGFPKSRAQIMQEITAERDAWLASFKKEN